MHAGYEVNQIFLYRDHVDFRKSIDGMRVRKSVLLSRRHP